MRVITFQLFRVRQVLLWLVILSLFASATGCKKKAAPKTSPPEVEVITVEPTNAPIYKQWIGSLDGFVNAQIRAQIAGYLLTQNYTEGSMVKKGDLLFEIDPRPFQAALEQAQAKLAEDKAQETRTKWDVDRYEPLVKKNAISQQEYNNAVQSNLAAQAQVKADDAAVVAARLNLGFTRVDSPIDGLAGVANAQIGDLVGPSGPVLTTVSKIDPIKVIFNASEQAYISYRRQYTNETERIQHEQELQLELILSDGSIYPFKGKFAFAGREVNPTTGTIELVGTFPNPAGVLRPGQFGRVRARTQIRHDALLVPQRAVSELQGSDQVTVVDGQNKAQLVTVTLGEMVGKDWIIEKGLKPGERVVVEGLQKAKEGTVVKPVPFEPKKTRAGGTGQEAAGNE